MGHTGVGWIIQELGGSCRKGVHNTGVGWVMLGWCGVGMGWTCRCGVGGSCRGGMGHAVVGSGGSYRGGMGWVMKNIKLLVLQGI